MLYLRKRRLCVFWALLAVVLSTNTARAESARFIERQINGASLAYVNEVPVLSLQGTPKDMGRQLASLAGPAAERLIDYPREAFGGPSGETGWKRLLKASRALWPNIPNDHREELATVARLSGIDRDALLAGNVMMDVYRGMNCSSLMVEPARSATEGPLFGRNLDFFGRGYLHKYTLVTVYRPRGKHAFASVGFAGLFGCLTGMNDQGLTLAIHEVIASRDGSRLFNPEGVPYGFALRRIMEECSTVDEAEKLIRSIKRTTMYNIGLCDKNKAVVLEVTPKNVVRRKAVAGLCPCTNHFRTAELAVFPFCSRFTALTTDVPKKLTVDDVIKHMHAANMGRLTLHTAVFEPAELRMHLAFGRLPASAGPYHKLDLKPLFKAKVIKPE